MKVISVELNWRTHFLEAALSSQMRRHGTNVHMCTLHMCMFLSADILCVSASLSLPTCVSLACAPILHMLLSAYR